MNFYIGQICLFPWNWSPAGWAKCDGSSLPINDYQALFALLGTEFGGDGQTNFCLPDLSEIRSKTGGRVDYYICMQGSFPNRT